MIDAQVTKKQWLGRVLRSAPALLLKRIASFGFNGARLRYHCSLYNLTWWNERSIELPLVMAHLQGGGRILEVGRVLDHYVQFEHDCVDKFEPGAINIDIVDFEPDEPYDTIVSISTLEHVGWDEGYDPTKVFRAVASLEAALKPGGTLVATIPFGYNHDLDRAVLDGAKLFNRQYYFRKSRFGLWKQTPTFTPAPYDFRSGSARSVLLGVTSRES